MLARLLTARRQPFKEYLLWIVTFEALFGIISASMIAVVFPNSWGTFLWSNTTSPFHWVVYVLCLLAFPVRAHILFRTELPPLRQRLKDAEYEKWAHVLGIDTDVTTTDKVHRPLSYTYQYHSWPTFITIITSATVLMCIGLTVDRPYLYDIAILAGYVLIAAVLRMTVEILWRLPILKGFKSSCVKWLIADYRKNAPALNEALPFEWTARHGLTQAFFKPDMSTEASQSMDLMFDDPMYFPEEQVRMSAM